jgi:uncharacterized protein (DUF1778 family)
MRAKDKKVFNLYLSEEEKAKIQAAAKQAGMSMHSYILHLCSTHPQMKGNKKSK